MEPPARRGRAPRPFAKLRRAAASAVLAVVLVACGQGAGKTAAGVVIALDASSGTVHSFTLRSTDGQVLTFEIGQLETDGAAFPAAHLAEHAVTLAPISVAYREEGSAHVVYRLVDAPWASPT